MATIHCPNCGAVNRRGRSFCSECGAPLPQGGSVRCPVCGRSNPAGAATCLRCKAPLIQVKADSAAEGEEPARPSGTAAQEIAAGGASAQSTPQARRAQSTAPQRKSRRSSKRAWLNELRASVEPGEAAEQLPSSGEEPQGEPGAGQTFEMPGWLKEGGESDASSQDAPSEQGLPGFDFDELPAWMQTVPPTSEVEDDVPNWLRQVRAGAMLADLEPGAGGPSLEHGLPEGTDRLQGPTGPTTAPQVDLAEAAADTPPGSLAPAEIPEWLRALRPSAEEPVGQLDELAPEWHGESLAFGTGPDVGGAGSSVPVAETEPESPDGLEEAPLEPPVPAVIPDWLQALQPRADEGDSELAGVGEGAEGAPPVDETDWLWSPPPVAKPQAEADAGQQPPAIEVPEWLRLAAEGELTPGEGLEFEPEDVQPWPETALSPGATESLGGEGASISVSQPGQPAMVESADTVTVPDWLRDMIKSGTPIAPAVPEPEAPGEEEQPEPEQAAPEPPTPAERAGWLRSLSEVPEETELSAVEIGAELATQDDEGPQSTAEVSRRELASATEEAALLGAEDRWLAALEAELAQEVDLDELKRQRLVLPQAEAPRAVEPQAGGLAQAEIPAWLGAARAGAGGGGVFEAAVAEEGGQVAFGGVLQGLTGVLPLAPVIEIPSVPKPAPTAESAEASIARATLLQGLVARTPQLSQVQEEAQPRQTALRLQRLLVFIVLAALVTAALVAPYWAGSLSPLVSLPQSLPAADGLYSAVESLHAGDSVVVAFEYGAAEADEMALVAAPVLRHMLDRGAHLVVVSSRAEGQMAGVALLQSVLGQGDSAETQTQAYSLPAGSYQPGDALGVAALLGVEPSAALTVVLAGQPAPLRWWIEQATAAGGGPRLAVVTSASLEPLASPYLAAGADQVVGGVSGVSAAAYYEQALLDAPGRASFASIALAAGHLGIVVMVLLGAVIFAVAGAFRRRV